MKIKKLAAVSALTIAGMVGTAATSTAGPITTPDETIGYTARAVDGAAVISTDAGSLEVVDGQFRVLSNTGKVVAGVPLSYSLDDNVFPIAASISGNTATLTPALPRHQVASFKSQEDRDKAAFDNLRNQVGFGVTIGAIVGTVVGAAVGCVVGGVVAAPTAIFTAIFGPLAGCVAAGAVMAPVGALGGTLLVAGPVAVVSAVQYFTTVNERFTPPA